MSKWIMLTLVSVLIGAVITALSFLNMQNTHPYMTSCESQDSDIYKEAIQTKNGFPFSYYSRTHDTFNQKCMVRHTNYANCADLCSGVVSFKPVPNEFLPKQFIADVALWSLAAFVVFALTPKVRKKK
jgi:hypothetical protein